MVEYEYLCEVKNLKTGKYESLGRPMHNRMLAVNRALEQAKLCNQFSTKSEIVGSYDLEDYRVKMRTFEVIVGGWEYTREEEGV